VIKKIIEKIESKVNIENDQYQENLKIVKKDFIEYCMPGSVNNWTHPELPPAQASFVTLCNLIKFKRILDFGSGLSSYCLRKNLNYKTDITSIDNSFVWLSRLFDFCEKNNINTKNFFWLYDHKILNLEKLPLEFLKSKEKTSIKNPGNDYEGKEKELISEICFEPEIYWVFTDTSPLNSPNVPSSLDNNATKSLINLKKGSKNILLNTGNNFETLNSLGKFDFIHFDYGGMRTRESYLKAAFDMLDRTNFSIIYVDDLHRDTIIYDNKKFIDIVDDFLINEKKGIKINCQNALTDSTGGFGAFYIFEGDNN